MMRKGTVRAKDVLLGLIRDGITDPVILEGEIRRLTGEKPDSEYIRRALRRKELSTAILRALGRDPGTAMSEQAILAEIRPTISFSPSDDEIRSALKRLSERGRVRKVVSRRGRSQYPAWASKQRGV